MAESYATNFFFSFKSCRFHKACKVNKMLRFLKIFFSFYFISSVFLVVFFWKFYSGRRGRKATFLKVSRKWAQNRDSGVGFSVYRVSLWILRRSDADIYTVWSTWYYLTVGKRIFKNFQLIRDVCQFLCVGSGFFSLRIPKCISGLCFHYSAWFASFAFRNFIFLGRFRNTVLF